MALRRKNADKLFKKQTRKVEPPIVEVKGLYKTYSETAVPVQALRGVGLTVKRGEMVAIMGASGSGKTTLLNMIGLLDSADKGSVHFRGEDVTKLRRKKLSKFRQEEIGFVFQQKNLIPTLTALENVYLPFRYRRGKKADKREHAEEALRLVGMLDRADHKPSQLSGGQQQRVAIARALVLNPAVILGDEPTGELDTKTGRSIVELMQELNTTIGQTFILVTHNEAVAAACHRTVVMEDGKIIDNGKRKR
jgi:ABC-type lipoprotein export system ATPase subunit